MLVETRSVVAVVVAVVARFCVSGWFLGFRRPTFDAAAEVGDGGDGGGPRNDDGGC